MDFSSVEQNKMDTFNDREEFAKKLLMRLIGGGAVNVSVTYMPRLAVEMSNTFYDTLYGVYKKDKDAVMSSDVQC